jgi:carbon starvation protein
MSLHAMPVMLGVLAILAIAYRYYSAFLAARVAALDDSVATPAYRFRDGHNFDPTNKWVLFGHHFAAISGAGPLIGPVLAIQFGYLPGLIWLVVGVCLAGAVQDMTVLALSTQRGGMSLAGLARREIGRPAGIAATIAILYIIIIALAGLGIVVVKALGGEEIPLKAGTVLVYPEGADIRSILKVSGPRLYEVPPQTTYRFGETADQTMVFHESFNVVVPRQTRLKGNPNGPGWVLPEKARRLVPGSSWGTFTIACTIPIALFVGWYMYRLRQGKVIEASIIGAVAVVGVTILGALIPGSVLEPYFSLSRSGTVFALAGYGFVAAVLPVWLLLCPRDYLSSFLKIGTIALLVLGVIVANPKLEAPPISPHFAAGGGPYFDGPIFPYVFICIMCGAISGFHALVSSGTTPKMVSRQRDIRMIGYGAMLMEGLVGVVALIAAAALPNAMYYDINIDLGKRPGFMAKNPDFARFLKASEFDPEGGHGAMKAAGPGNAVGAGSELVAMEKDVRESLHGRTGGAVTLAVGMARIFSGAIPGVRWLIAYWYHFAIMFEALFILTTIDAGTRIARFLVQEFLGRIWRPLGNLDWLPAALLATGLVVFGWGYFIYTGSVETIWPMFGMANQLLAVIALAVVTTGLVNAGRGRYAAVTLLPMLFVATTTSTTGYYEITGKFSNMIRAGEVVRGWLNIGLTLMLLACVAVILSTAVVRWITGPESEATTRSVEPGLAEA